MANAPKNLPASVQAAPIESIGHDTDWSAALTGIDTVIHLAARVHVMDEASGDPLTSYREVNVAGTENLARQAAAHGVRRLVFLSSVKVHGEATEIPYQEHIHPAPQDPYGVSKLEAETVLHQITAETGLEVVIIRPPLVYGPGVKANFLNLLKIVESGLPLPLASITNARSLVYLGNLIDAIITCTKHPKAAGQTFLVSDCKDVSTPMLIRQVANALGRPVRLFPFPPSLIHLAGNLTGKSMAVDRLLGSLVVDSGKIQQELGWKPPFTMAEGLAVTAKWYKGRHS
jgi:nucleoside-diphosphate-sugar epimerase